jgi:hypothetical protein
MAWVLDYADDLDSDFRVFYRKSWDEMVATETGPRFFALAYRTGAYQGVMAARYEEQENPTVGSDTAQAPDEVTVSGGSIGELLTSPAGDLIEYGEG